MVHLKTGVSLAEADHWYRNGPASVSPVPGAVSPVPGVCVTCAQRLASTAANGSGRKTGRGQHDISVQERWRGRHSVSGRCCSRAGNPVWLETAQMRL